MKPQLTILPEPITLTTHIWHKTPQTLLNFLVDRFHYHSREEWETLINEGKVKVNHLTSSPGQPLRAGDEIAYTTNAWEEPEVRKDYRVVYEDETLFVLSKPAPLPVHAIGAYFKNTLMHLLREDIPESRNYHLIHRLDSETSGLLILVKDQRLVAPFQKAWNQDTHKTYRAIVFRKFPEGRQTVDGPIGPKKGSPIRIKLCVNPVEGRPSKTEFELLETRGHFSLLEARPITGRTHQLRVHLEHLGFPIVGDKLYSGDDETFLHFYENGWDEHLAKRVLLPRQALHAFRLELTHPETGKKMEFEDPLPEDLASFWDSAAIR